MFVSWNVLTDPVLTKLDLVVYVTVVRSTACTVQQVCRATELEESLADESLGRLVMQGHLAEGKHVYRVVTRFDASLPYLRSDQTLKLSEKSKNSPHIAGRKEIATQPSTPIDSAKLSWSHAAKAAINDNKSGQWTPLGLMGLFHNNWKRLYTVDYPSRNSFKMDLAEMEALCQHFGADLVQWFIRALFSPEMAWVKSKRLDFLWKHDVVTRHVLGIAMALRGIHESKPEYKPTQAGVIHDPLRRG